MRCVSLLIALVLGCAAAFPAAGQRIHGSGSTFVYPVLAKWSEAYQRTRGVHVEYQPIGSSGGLTEIRTELVDFGISDAPLTPDQLLRDGLAQFPVVIGAIVPVVNLDGVTAGQLRFTGQLLADIYLGKVKNWSDPAIAAVNPGIKLPERPILVPPVRRIGHHVQLDRLPVEGQRRVEGQGRRQQLGRLADRGGRKRQRRRRGKRRSREGSDRVCGIRLRAAEETGLRAGPEPGWKLRPAGDVELSGSDSRPRLGKGAGVRHFPDRCRKRRCIPHHGGVLRAGS
jgi:hypothetical protein